MGTKVFSKLLVVVMLISVPLTLAYAGLKTDNFEATYGVVAGTGTFSSGISASTISVTSQTGFRLGVSTTAGYVLTTDANGVGTWQPSVAGVSDHDALTSTGTLTHLELEAQITALDASTITLRTDVNTLDASTQTLSTAVSNRLLNTSDTLTGTLTVTAGVAASTGVFSGTLDADTLNTGNGDYELFAMNQDVETTDDVTFSSLSVTNLGGFRIGVSTTAGYVLTTDANGVGTWQPSVAGVSDHDALTSTGTLTHLELEAQITALDASTITLRTDVNTLDASTQTLSTAVSNRLLNTSDTLTGTLTVTAGVAASTGVFSGTLDADTLNTGNGDYELFAMDQDVQTTDDVTFSSATITNTLTASGDLALSATSTVLYGPDDTDGSWKTVRVGNDLVTYRYDTDTWVEKYRVIP
ncbi:hypothetical protein ACFL58_00855 [Elusimicrobiota bacterium]